MAGRKSLKEELRVVKYMAELEPRFFKVLEDSLKSPQLGDRQWAVEQLAKLYAKAVPQKIGGDPNNETPITISLLGGATQHVHRNNSTQ